MFPQFRQTLERLGLAAGPGAAGRFCRERPRNARDLWSLRNPESFVLGGRTVETPRFVIYGTSHLPLVETAAPTRPRRWQSWKRDASLCPPSPPTPPRG